MCGRGPASATYFMNKFRTLGFLDYDGTIKIHGSL